MLPFRMLILFAFFLTLSSFAAPTFADDRPNIILIMSDDMGYSDIGCYGGEISTPTLDKLAANGVRFSQFYNTSRCCPTRASLLTGLYQHQAGVGRMMGDDGVPGYRGNLNDRCRTIAEVLRPAGYSTYMVGKWHVTPGGSAKALENKRNWPLQRGFDRFYGTIHGAGSFYDPNSLTRDNENISPLADPKYKPDEFFYTDAISDNAVMFIKDHHEKLPDKPFFMYIAYTAAHWPMHAREKNIAKYKGNYARGYQHYRTQRLKKMIDLGLIDPKWELSPVAGEQTDLSDDLWEQRCMEVYAAMVDCMDQGIGKVVAALDQSQQLENTLILFFQDNGGCHEGMGRGKPNKAATDPGPLQPMRVNELQYSMIPKVTRDGKPMRQGRGVMPGPADTYIGYGRAWANVSNTPFREYKHWVHEGGISSPLIAHWPRGIDASRNGKIEHQVGHLIDMMATCVDLAEATYPERVGEHEIWPMEGVSLAPALNGKDVVRKNSLFWEHYGNCAIRDGKWKLVGKRLLKPDGPDESKWELYDLEADRTEMHDLASKHPEKVEELSRKWTAWAKRAKVLPLPGARNTKKK